MNRNVECRRRFLRDLGIGTAALPFLTGLRSLGATGTVPHHETSPKRLVIMFSPNGTLPDEFWPDSYEAKRGDQRGDDVNRGLQLKPMLKALEPFRDQTLLLKGVHNQVGGDGDNHMRGMSCLLTARQLNPGNIQGGGHTPAGWASGISIDQEVRNFFQAQEGTRTRFGSLEFGVAVPDRADPWTRMCYAGSDRPVAPIDDPEQMFQKMYGGAQDRKTVASVLDHVRDDLSKLSQQLSASDRHLLDQHLQNVRQLETQIAAASSESELVHPEPDIDPNIELVNDNTPDISRMQIDLLVNGLANDLSRVATLQFMRSVGQARMRWLGIDEGHHSLSHEPDGDEQAHQKLRRINAWFAGELAYLAKRLSEIPEPGRPGETLLDNTQIVWLNELGKGNSHTLDDIPFLLVGGGAGFKTGRAIDCGGVPHNRLWMSIAHGLGHQNLTTFGSPEFCHDGPLKLS
ncbi:DUF1552 domain-containing protein [Roseiconus lacunae]|uniref:DUF1552 domain-containing protein n=1 Tax=Roseiconus lacunae TaxID=2605694 RepID=UPI001E638FC9|nr:DUF1552 domain-containing protein [Roseiconus lacunae]MCD0463607.1 DUF1552 domain-containing protein [Roseiconus lacunae]